MPSSSSFDVQFCFPRGSVEGETVPIEDRLVVKQIPAQNCGEIPFSKDMHVEGYIRNYEFSDGEGAGSADIFVIREQLPHEGRTCGYCFVSDIHRASYRVHLTGSLAQEVFPDASLIDVSFEEICFKPLPSSGGMGMILPSTVTCSIIDTHEEPFRVMWNQGAVIKLASVVNKIYTALGSGKNDEAKTDPTYEGYCADLDRTSNHLLYMERYLERMN